MCATIAWLLAVSLIASDWPQMLGPNRDGSYSGPPLADGWPAGGPAVVWKKDVGQGLSGPVVADGTLVIFHRTGTREVIEAWDAATGAPRWRYDYPTAYRDDFGFDEGPRAVPVIHDDIVYTFGAEGQLHAVALATGRKIWSVDTAARFGVPKGFFGAAGSPVVEAGRLIANLGGREAGIVAFDAKTGRVLWTATRDGASYSSGRMATIAGRRVAVFLTRTGLVGLDPADGAVRFRQAWRSRSDSSVNAATPLIVGDDLFVSAEYGPGAGVLRVADGGLSAVWASNDALSTHYATAVHRDGILYGFHGRQELGPSLRAVEFGTGKVRWSVEQFRAGSVTLAGDLLVIVREAGELVLARATPDAFQSLGRAQILTGTVRALPALSDGFLYVRNERTLVKVDLRPGRLQAEPSQQASAVLDRAIADFRAGRVEASVAGFDRVVALAPQVTAQLWQRGIALYYAGRFAECRHQFESHRTVNPNDVENAAWHYLCVARGESPEAARAALLPVGRDPRAPMPEIYDLFRGRSTPARVRAAAGESLSAEFYANLYLGLFLGANGEEAGARQHIATAANAKFAAVGGYMHDVAKVHLSRMTGRRASTLSPR